MIQISVDESKANTEEFIMMAQDQDIFITQNGKVIAKLVTAKVDKVAAARVLLGILPSEVDLDVARDDRLK